MGEGRWAHREERLTRGSGLGARGSGLGTRGSGLGAREGSTPKPFRGDRLECSSRNRRTPAASGDGAEEEPSDQKCRPPHWIGQPVRDQSCHTAQREHRKRSPGHYAQDPAWDRLAPALNRGKGDDERRSAQSDDEKIEVVAPGAHHQRVIRPAAGKSRRYAKCPPQVRRCEQHRPCARGVVKPSVWRVERPTSSPEADVRTPRDGVDQRTRCAARLMSLNT